jgi:hypothetical protein
MAESESNTKSNAPPAKAQRDRSPPYPFISLKAAIDRLVTLEKYFGRHKAPAVKAGLAWDMNEKSSQAFQTLAAMKYFGLVDYEGVGDERVASITDDGRNYLRAQQGQVKQEILKRIALKPAQIALYWERWGADRPPSPVCLDELVLKGKYTESAAKTFLNVYDETIAYAGLSNSGKVDNPDSEGNQPAFKVGDFVQWESGGVLQFEAKRVYGVSEDRKFVFVEGSQSGLPVSEVKIVETPNISVPTTGSAAVTGHAPTVITSGFNQDVYTLGSEGKVILQWPDKMSQESYEELSDWMTLQLKKIARLNKLTPK